MIRTVLEEIVTIFTGDSKQFDKVLNHVVSGALAAQTAVEKSVNKIAAAVSKPIARARHNFNLGVTRGLQGATGPMRTWAGTVGQAMGGFSIPHLMGGAQNALGAAGTHLHNFRRGVSRGFAGAPGPMQTGMGKFGYGVGSVPRNLFGPIISSVNSAITTTGMFFSHFNRGIRRMWYDVRMMGQGFRRNFVTPFLAAITASTYAFAKFDDSIHYAMALFGDTTAEMERKLTTTITDIAKKSRTSPQELVEVMKVLASANYSAADAMKVMGTAEKFYVASGMDDAKRSTELLIGVQSALGLRVEDSTKNLANMNHVANLMVKANQLAQVSVEDFAAALTNRAAAGLRLVGKDAEEGIAVLIAFAQQNVKGAEAGTQLAIVLRDVQRAAVMNPKQWQALIGKNPVFSATGELQNLGQIVSALSSKFAMMTDEQRTAATKMLGFNDRSSNAIKMLMGFGGQISKFEKALRGMGDEMERVYQERMRSLLSMLRNLWNWIHITGIEIGRLLEPEIKALGRAVKQTIGVWNSFSDGTKRMFIYAGFAAIAIASVVAVVVALAAAAAAAVSAWSTLGPVLAAVVGALGSVVAFLGGGEVIAGVALVAAAIGGLIYLIAGPEGLAAAWSYVWGTIKTGFRVWLYFVKAIGTALAVVARIAFSDFTQLPQVFENLMYNFGVAIGGMSRIMMAFFGWMTARIEQLFTVDFVVAFIRGLVAAAGYAMKFFVVIGQLMFAAMSGNIRGVKGLIEGFSEEMAKSLEAFSAGHKTGDLGKTITDIINDTAKSFRALDQGINQADPKNRIEEQIVTPLQDAKDTVDAIKSEFAHPFNMVFSSKGLEGIAIGTVEAFDAIRSHLEQMSPDMSSAGVAAAYSGLIGVPDFSGGMIGEATNGGDKLDTTNDILTDILDELRANPIGTGETVTIEAMGIR